MQLTKGGGSSNIMMKKKQHKTIDNEIRRLRGPPPCSSTGSTGSTVVTVLEKAQAKEIIYQFLSEEFCPMKFKDIAHRAFVLKGYEISKHLLVECIIEMTSGATSASASAPATQQQPKEEDDAYFDSLSVKHDLNKNGVAMSPSLYCINNWDVKSPSPSPSPANQQQQQQQHKISSTTKITTCTEKLPDHGVVAAAAAAAASGQNQLQQEEEKRKQQKQKQKQPASSIAADASTSAYMRWKKKKMMKAACTTTTPRPQEERMLIGAAKKKKEPTTTSNDDDPSPKKYTEAFFQQLLDHNMAQLKPLLPILDATQSKFFQAACQHVQDCNKTLQTAIAKRAEIQRHKPVDQDALDKANKAVEAATAALEQSQKDVLRASEQLLDTHDQTPMAPATYQLLLQTNVLVDATPKGLATYCAGTTDDTKKEALVQLLQDPSQFGLLQSMVLAGGAKHGKYGQALELYNQLQAYVLKDNNQALWQRMALAVALELADPIPVFGHTSGKYKDGTTIDPIQRFLHYRQAWQFDELDPVFGSEFGVWELRMALNSVAPNDQLSWGRQMLRNYRPDLMALKDKWRYCRIVRTDVFYTGHPNWDTTKPLDFKQVLSGGGECGPRAWMGRFICRAFGIPTWGVREPGHAAMARWTKDEGWVVCLGAPMKVAWWETEGGLHFQVEAAARKVLQPKDDLNKPNLAYGQKVMTLEWIANVNGEPMNQVVRNAFADPTAIWRSLSLMQMRRLAPPPPPPPLTSSSSYHPPALVPQLERLQLRNCTIKESIATLPNGTIIIPASTCTTKPTQNIMLMDSFLGGKQLFLDKDGHAEYTLVSPPSGKYRMKCHIVTVHDDKVKPPLLVTIDAGEGACDDDLSLVGGDDDEVVVINDDGDDDSSINGHDVNVCSVYSIPLQCTWGMWEETQPVVVELPAGVATCQIAISREASANPHGLVIKDIWLVPVTGV